MLQLKEYRLFLQQITAAEQCKIANLVERCNVSKSQRRGGRDGGTFRTIAGSIAYRNGQEAYRENRVGLRRLRRKRWLKETRQVRGIGRSDGKEIVNAAWAKVSAGSWDFTTSTNPQNA